jgi:hypothetical protein
VWEGKGKKIPWPEKKMKVWEGKVKKIPGLRRGKREKNPLAWEKCGSEKKKNPLA